MDAMVGGPVACFVFRVLETLQYLCRGRGVTSLLFLPEWVVRRCENFSQSRLLFARCVWQKEGVGGRNGGHVT
jgi:hypothetical protein